ncbi:potassium-transporting ATPase subunit F [Salinisphaera sp. T31B1]
MDALLGWVVIAATVGCLAYLVYVIVRPERF